MNGFTKNDLLAFLAVAKQAAGAQVVQAISAGIGTLEDGAMFMRMFDLIAEIVEEYGP
jgi:hypothetical protein